MAVCRLLARAAGLTAMAGPEAKLQGNAALQLAVRLGLQPATMLAALLHSTTGVTLYTNFPAVVDTAFCSAAIAFIPGNIS